MTPRALLWIKVIGMAAALGFLVWLGNCWGDDGKDPERQREEALAERDTARALVRRQAVEIEQLRRGRRDDSLFRVESSRRDAAIAVTLGRLQQDVRGIVRLLPEPGTSDTAELVGPRTNQLIADLRSQNARKDSTIERADVREKRLLFVTDSLQMAFWALDSAFAKLDSAALTWKGRQWTWWKDGLSVGPSYGALECPPDSDRSICKGWGLTVQYAAVRPVRLVTDQLPRLVRRLF